jgi:hypothetical protein
MYLYLKGILGDKKHNVSNQFIVLSYIATETILFVISNTTLLEFTFIALFIRICSNLICTYLLTLFHSASLAHRLFATLSLNFYFVLSEGIVGNFIIVKESHAILIAKLLTLLCVLFTIFFWNRKQRNTSYTYTFLTLLTPILSLVLIIVFFPLGDYISQSNAFMVLILVLLFINITNYILVDRILEMAQIRQHQQYLEHQLQFQADKYQQISNSYRNLRGFMHDTNKHFVYIKECIIKEKYNSLIQYLDNASEELKASYSTYNTGNLVIDSFLTTYANLAFNQNISFRAILQVQVHRIPISDYDFSIILGNLLDNSMTALSNITPPKPRQLEVELFTNRLEFVIHITNSTNFHPIVNANNNSHNDFSHGYGLENIRRITTYHDGICNILRNDEVFEIAVIIPIKNDVETTF